MTRKKGFPVIRIIDGVAYERKSGTTFRVKAFQTPSGHLEASAVRQYEWHELELTSKQLIALESAEWNRENDPIRKAEREATAREVAANRAKTRVRRLCKSMGADTLLTLTYRANEADLARVKLDIKAFNRRMEVVLPEFRFVAAFEKQKRGAWHVHMATAGIPMYFWRDVVRGGIAGKKTGKVDKVMSRSFDVIRAVWRSVTKDRGGNIDVSRRKRNGRSTPAQIAAYLSKYMAKDFETVAKGTNRYAVYGKFEVHLPEDLGIVANALEAVEVCYSLLGDRVVFDQHFSRWGDWFYLHAERSSG